MKKVLFGLVGIVAIAGIIGFVMFTNWKNAMESGALGQERDAGSPKAEAVSDAVIIARRDADLAVAPENKIEKQILFGDLHVHSTYSTDAFMWALPMNHGKGVHPVADACDYARYCSAIDFWSITDHAEAGTPRRWQQTKDAIRQCQSKALDQDNPDLVSYVGFEWTQVGRTPADHYGHKNVIFEGLEDDEISARAIAAEGAAMQALRTEPITLPWILAASDLENKDVYYDFNTFIKQIQDVDGCDRDVPSNELPKDCYEYSATPGELLARLESQGLDPLVIPHGSSWGFYTPTGTTWDKQLKKDQRPEKMRLVEIYSGHGNSEEYREYRAAEMKDIGNGDFEGVCPPKTATYTPPCVRAGEIILARCQDEGLDASTCADKAAHARHAAANMSVPYHLAVASELPEEWLESGQCTDCYLPPFHHRPGTSVQYGLAISNFDELDENGKPTRFNWGFIGSSDNHRSRPGTGYKEVARRLTTEAGGITDIKYRKAFIADEGKPDSTVHEYSREELTEIAGFGITEIERQSSFWQTGGLAAVHTEGRSRNQIWDALQRRETYSTSGPRMLMWFDRIAADGSSVPMGGNVDDAQSGKFKVKAVGSYKQKDGCPEYAEAALGADRLESLCSNECYNPTNERNLIERIEIIRIRPQIVKGEPVMELIDDPYLVHHCPPNQDGCEFTFEDPDFATSARDTLYYARAIQEPRMTINGEPIDCERDADGQCVKATLCYGDYRSPIGEDCLSMKDVRAWSSPIYVGYDATKSASIDDMEFVAMPALGSAQSDEASVKDMPTQD